MTPAEHLTAAEGLLAQVGEFDTEGSRGEAAFLAAWAAAHALMAIAVELGAPHPAAPGGGETSAPQAPPG